MVNCILTTIILVLTFQRQNNVECDGKYIYFLTFDVLLL